MSNSRRPHDLGRRTSLTRGNGTVTSYGFDPVSRLASLAENMTGTTSPKSLELPKERSRFICTAWSRNLAEHPHGARDQGRGVPGGRASA